MAKSQSVVSLDPIDVHRKKNPGLIGRFMITRWFRGKPCKRTDEFGTYLFCGTQRSGKTVSMTWFMEQLKKKYEKQGKNMINLMSDRRKNNRNKRKNNRINNRHKTEEREKNKSRLYHL